MLSVRAAVPLFFAAAFLEGGPARAQPPAAAAGVSPAEWAEIQAAAGADAATNGPAASDPAPPSSPAPMPVSMNPNLSLIADTALAWFSDEEPLQSGGHDPTKTGFNWQQLELSLSAAVDPYFRFDSFIVFSQLGVEVEEAYATSLALPFNLQLRIGQFLTRFGRQNQTHPHAWDFVDQPFALGRVFGAENNRGLGYELSYLAPLPWYVEAVLSFTDAAGEGTARSFYGATDLGIDDPLDAQVTVALKQFFPFTDALGLSFGLSGAAGPNPTGHGTRTEVYGTDLYLKYRPVDGRYTTIALQSEWLYRRRQIPRDVLSDVNGYAYAAVRFARRWSSGLRYEYGSPAYGQGGERALDELDPFWTDHRHRVSAQLTFVPSEFSRLRLQAGMDAPGWRPDPGWSVMLATEFLIGAHGVHRY